jgi:serpin B
MPTAEFAGLSDDAVLQRAVAGERAALEALLERHAPTALAYACTILSNREDATDAAQSALVRMAREVGPHWQGRSFKACLYVRVHDEAADLRVKEARLKRRELAVGAQDAQKEAEMPCDRIERDEALQALRQELAALPSETAVLLTLHHLDGLPLAEIAPQMAISVDACKQRLMRGRDDLRQRLERRGVTLASVALLPILDSAFSLGRQAARDALLDYSGMVRKALAESGLQANGAASNTPDYGAPSQRADTAGWSSAAKTGDALSCQGASGSFERIWIMIKKHPLAAGASLLSIALLLMVGLPQRFSTAADQPAIKTTEVISTSKIQTLELSDVHGLYGGRKIDLLSDGTIWVRLIRFSNEGKPGFRETRYKTILTVEEREALSALLSSNNFWAQKSSSRSGIPDEGAVSIKVVTSQGAHVVRTWYKDQTKEFHAIYETLLAISKRIIEQVEPLHTGPYDGEWSPQVSTAEPPKAEEKTTLTGDNNAFALSLYAKLKDSEKGNLFFSPFSISSALAMTYAGARGNTAKEMEQALHFSLGQERLHPVYGAFIQELNAAEKNGKKRGYQLAVANRLFGQKDYVFLPPFLELTQRSYGAGLQALDFKADAESSRQTINKWVEGQTQERIKDLIPAGGVTRDTRLVLTNAIYFKGDWAEQFEKKKTRDAVFHLAADGDIQAPTMNKTGEFKYYEEPGKFQVLELPYKDNELSMLVFLPAKINGLAELEKSLTGEMLKRSVEALHEQEVKVALPKFKLTWGTKNIKKTLESLGIKAAFNPAQANFAGMTNDPAGLYISAVYHKTFVDVNEEGTEAAAATAVIEAEKGKPLPDFIANHPFVFLIRENATGSILFMGRVADPRP